MFRILSGHARRQGNTAAAIKAQHESINRDFDRRVKKDVPATPPLSAWKKGGKEHAQQAHAPPGRTM